MYCNQCGKQIPDDAKFCHHCGSAIGAIQNNEPTNEQPEKKPQRPKKKKEKPDKAPASGGKRKWIFIVVAVVVVGIVAAAIGVINVVKNHQEVLAELPDPEYYFANGPIDEVNEHDDVKQVILRSDENLWNEAAGYVNLLKWSGKYPVTQSDEKRYSSGDYMWNFTYNNEEDIKNPYFCQVEVNYYCKSNGRDVYAVWITIHDTDAFDLVQKEKYEEPTQVETAPGVNSSGVGGTDNTGTSGDGTASETPIVSEPGDSSDSFVEEDDDDSGYDVPEAADIYDNPTPCGVCNGDGDCQTCSGDGYLMSSASDEEDRNCYSCSGSGNCRSCGGDGEL